MTGGSLGMTSRSSALHECLAPLRDLLGDVRGIGADAADEGGAHAVLEALAEEEEARCFGNYTALVTGIACVIENRQIDPLVVGCEARAPDDDAGLQRLAIADRKSPALGVEPPNAADACVRQRA